MIRIALALLALTFAVPAAAQEAPAPVRAEIRAALNESAAGWNSGDIERFLSVYADAATTSFVGADVVHGIAPIRRQYLETYPDRFSGRSGEGGRQLSFTFHDIRMLGRDHVLAIARWHLSSTADAPAASGMTSLVFRRTPAGWKIIADHSN